MKHPPEDHSLYNIDMIKELVEEFTQLDSDSNNMSPFVEIFNMFPSVDSVTEEANLFNRTKVLDTSDSGFRLRHNRSLGPTKTTSKLKFEPNSQPTPALNLRKHICFGH
ncbi:hypothetical protein CR513_15303, partial [Mucuna pruriens]